ncbi:MAG: zf-HC2 domain-containing protein [Planctomycetes bacterium]|nr:zf-HC2 domain-containing protein [Planctomycetota bacterium]
MKKPKKKRAHACRRASELISLSLDRPLDRAERRALFWHVVICSSCRTFRKQVESVRSFLRADGTAPLPTSFLDANLSDDARARIRAALESAR